MTLERLAIPDDPHPTPLERRDPVWLKRDDLYREFGAWGAKARVAGAVLRRAAADGYRGACVGVSRNSSIPAVVAKAAAAAGLQAMVYFPHSNADWRPGARTEFHAAREAGAILVPVRPGYLSVVQARARAAAQLHGYALLPLGLEGWEGVRQTASSAAALAGHLPAGVRRLVVPVGSGMMLSGILWGLRKAGLERLPVLGVAVGQPPDQRLDTYAPPGWRRQVALRPSGSDFLRPASRIEHLGVRLDHSYEAKCVPYLEPDDLFWLVALRSTLGEPTPAIAAESAGVPACA